MPDAQARITLRLPKALLHEVRCRLLAQDIATGEWHALNTYIVALIERDMAEAVKEGGKK